MNAELPEGWAEVPLQSLTSVIQYGYTASGEAGIAGPRMLRITDIQNGRVDWATVPGCTIEQTALKKYELASGDIVFARSGATTGKSFLIRSCPENAVFASYLIRVRGRVGVVLPEFLSQFFATPNYWAYITDSLAGNAQPNCNGSKLAALPVALAPLPEQHRIVEKVEALLEQVNRAKERLDRVPLILKRFRQAVLAAACSGKLTNPDVDDDSIPNTWRRTSLDDLLPPGGLFDGPFGSSLKTSDYCAEGVRVIRLENVQQLRFVPEKETFISHKKYESLRKHTVGEGDIIFGSFVDETVRVCVLPRLVTPAIAKADCFCIRPRTDLVTKEYLAFQLACHRTRNALVEDIHGATRPRINTTQLRAVEIPLCPIEEQKEIGRQVQRLFTIADAIQLRLQTATARANKLPQAILSKAFSGELVPTEAELARLEGRTYETAEELLKRVTALGSDAPTAAKGRGRRARKAEWRSRTLGDESAEDTR